MFYQLIFISTIFLNSCVLFLFSNVSGLLPSPPPPPLRFKSPPLAPLPPPLPRQLSKLSPLSSIIINPGDIHKDLKDEDKHLKLASPYATSLLTFQKHRRNVDFDNFQKNPEDLSWCEGSKSKEWQAAEIEGDVILGGLLNIHERNYRSNCSSLTSLHSIRTLESMLYTIDIINNLDILRGIKLGAYILDSCEDINGLEQAKDFIKGSLSSTYSKTYRQPDGTPKSVNRKGIFGLIDVSSSTSSELSDLMSAFYIPQAQFSPFKYKFLSDSNQADAIVEIILKLKWTSISILSEYPMHDIRTRLKSLLSAKAICAALDVQLTEDLKVYEDSFYDDIVKRLKENANVRGVLILASNQVVAEVMRAVQRNKCTGDFSWIVSGDWEAKLFDFDANNDELEGAIAIQLHAYSVAGFDNYFQNLTVFNNTRNPWFKEFWEQFVYCNMSGINTTPYNINSTSNCWGNEINSKRTLYDTEEQLKFVSDSVLAFAFALKDMHQDLCGVNRSMCDKMMPFCEEMFSKYLQNRTFTDLSGDEFRFSGKRRFGHVRFNIFHFKQISKGNYKWVQVGEYSVQEMSMAKIVFGIDESKVPMSECNLSCSIGQVKKYSAIKCCGYCFNCTKYQILFNETTCDDCPIGQLPNTDYTGCEIITPQYVKLDSYWSILVMIFSCVGMVLTVFVISVYIKYNDTPVVKASSRELSYVLLGGIFLCYSVTFLLIQKPSDIKCGAQNIGICLCFTIIYGAVLTKTIRIHRIFRSASSGSQEPSFIKPKSQLIICGGMISIEVILSAPWLAINPPKAKLYYPTKYESHLVCLTSVDATYIVAITYPLVLVITCTIYAILTRKIPEAFNESKLIGFTMYTTCIVWLAFIPLYFITAFNEEISIFAMSVTVSLSATVALLCLFTSKVYIILMHPEKNVRQSLMKQSQYGIQNIHRMIPNILEHMKVLESSSDVKTDSKTDMSQTLTGTQSTSSVKIVHGISCTILDSIKSDASEE